MISAKRPPAFVPQEGNSTKLYILTLIIEFFTSVWLRGALYALIITVPIAASFGFLILNDNGLVRFLVLILALILSFSVLVVAFGPLVASVVAYLRYGGGNTATRFSLGAREPSTREMEQITTAQSTILSAATGNGVTSVKGLSGLFVIDSPMEFMYLVGTTLYLSSGSFGSKYFQSLLAHELGHNQSNDGATILALRRLVFPVSYLFVRNVRDFSTGRLTATREGGSASPSDVFYSMVNGLIFFVLSLVGGGVGAWLLSWSWASYFRERDYLADKFVVACNLKDELIAYLEENRFYDTSVPFMLNWQPANEQRIDKLQGWGAFELANGETVLIPPVES